MFTTSDILLGVVLPLVAAILLGLALRRFHALATPIAILLGFALGAIGLNGVGVLWPKQAIDWSIDLALALAATLVLARGRATLIGLAVIAIAASITLTYRKIENRWGWQEGSIVLVAAALGIFLTAWQFDALARRMPRATFISAGFLVGGTALVIALSDSMRLGQLSGALAVAMLGALGVALVTRISLARAASGASVIHAHLLLGALFFAGLSPASAALLGSAPLFAWGARWRGIARRSAFQRGFIQVVLVALPIALAIVLAAIAFVRASAANGPEDY